MNIIKLNLINFLGLNREIDFSPQFNVIIGANGTGKTRVLSAIRLLLSDLLPLFAAAPRNRRNLKWSNISDNEISFGSSIMAIDLKLKSIDNVDFEYTVNKVREFPTVLREKDSINFADFGNLLPRLSSNYFFEMRRSPNQPLILYYSAKRRNARYKTLGYPDGEYNNGYFHCLNSDGDMFSGISVWWMNKVEIGVHHQLNAVQNAIKIIFPEIVGWFVLDYELYFKKIVKYSRINTQTGESYFQEEAVDFRFEELSDGEQTMALFGLDIARRLAQLNPHDFDPISTGRGIVLIDEIDLHLHPKWQREIVDRLCKAFPKLQFICTTHSPFIIQSLRIGTLIRLDEDDREEVPAAQFHQQSIEDIVEDVQGVELPQKSKRYLDMMAAAENYYRRLHEVANEADTELLSLKRRLDELSIPFSDDAAFAALLKYERGTVEASKS